MTEMIRECWIGSGGNFRLNGANGCSAAATTTIMTETITGQEHLRKRLRLEKIYGRKKVYKQSQRVGSRLSIPPSATGRQINYSSRPICPNEKNKTV